MTPNKIDNVALAAIAEIDREIARLDGLNRSEEASLWSQVQEALWTIDRLAQKLRDARAPWDE